MKGGIVRGSVAGLLAVASVASAQSIYKCVDAGGTGYQSTPCPGGAAETAMAVPRSLPRAQTDASLSSPSPTPARRTLRKGPWKHTTLTLGISDDEVLNMPGWGKPSRIHRTRLPRQWHEEWIYDQGLVAEQRLYFVNAKLVDFVVVPEAGHLVRVGAAPALD